MRLDDLTVKPEFPPRTLTTFGTVTPDALRASTASLAGARHRKELPCRRKPPPDAESAHDTFPLRKHYGSSRHRDLLDVS